MAQPGGSCDVDDFGYTVTEHYASYSNNGEYIYFILPLPYMPVHWQTDGVNNSYKQHDVIHNIFVDITAGDTARISIDVNQPIVTTTDYDGDKDAWQTDIVINDAIKIPFTAQPDFGGSDQERQQYTVVEMRVSMATDSDDVEIDGAYWEVGNDVGYGNADPSGARKVELTNRDTQAKRLYTHKRTLSSWHAQRMLTHTLNKLINLNRYNCSIPLFGEYAP